MGGGEQGGEPGAELVVVALPGVQRFISEARSTADVAAASGIYSRLAGVIVRSLGAVPGSELIFPATVPEGSVERGMPNRVAALLPAHAGVAAAERAVAAADDAWRSWVRDVWRLPVDAPVPVTPGFPVLQWVCVPAGLGGYPEQWEQAQALLAARRRVRDFSPVPEEEWRRRALCSLTPRWPAERSAPPGTREHERELKLSAVGWVKRRWTDLNDEQGFPSTASIASAPYRAAVASRLDDPGVRGAVTDLEAAERHIRQILGIRGHETPVPGLGVPREGPGRWLATDGGPWVYPERWRPEPLARERTSNPAELRQLNQDIAAAAGRGRDAAMRLRDLLNRSPANYLAVLVQDLDSMGRFLRGVPVVKAGREISIAVLPGVHGQVSAELLHVAAAQRSALESSELLGTPVYAGGDDLLAFTPAAKALDAAVRCHNLVAERESLPDASTAVLFFHYHASIQQAMGEARRLLDQAKARVRGKHALAVGYLRRSGVSEASVQPWNAYGDTSSADLFGVFRADAEHRLSPRLLADLDRDAAELSSLVTVPGGIYRQEITRLVGRHLADPDGSRGIARAIADSLVLLGERERSPEEPGGQIAVRPQPAARVGVFLRQEAR